MKSCTNKSLPEEEITEQQVVDYLGRHADFFFNKNDLILEFILDHETHGNVASLLEYQNTLLRKWNKRLSEDLSISQERETGRGKITSASQALVSEVFLSSNIQHIHSSLQKYLAEYYSAEMFRFYFFAEPKVMPDNKNVCCKPRTHKTRRHFSKLLDRGNPLCDCLQIEYLEFFFSKRAPGIRSTVLIPLYFSDHDGLFVAGSSNAGIFRKGYELDQLTFVASLVANRVDSVIHGKT